MSRFVVQVFKGYQGWTVTRDVNEELEALNFASFEDARAMFPAGEVRLALDLLDPRPVLEVQVRTTRYGEEGDAVTTVTYGNPKAPEPEPEPAPAPKEKKPRKPRKPRAPKAPPPPADEDDDDDGAQSGEGGGISDFGNLI